MTSLRRFALGLVPTLLLLACGGKVGFDESDGGGTDRDSAVSDAGGSDVTPGDDATPIPTDGGPSGCGFGPCDPGIACFDGCNECSCVAKDSWSCTERACPDGGPIDPPPPPPCPASIPFDRTYCPSEGQYCTYKNTCGGFDAAQCVRSPDGGTQWVTKRETCTMPGCPATQPAAKTACPSSSLKCGYPNGCGGTNTAWCDGKTWNVEVGPCVAPTCPVTQPIEGTGCVGPNKCPYPNGCGGTNTAYCESAMSRWVIYKGDCAPPPPPPPSCPASMPPPGATCVVGSSCTWNNGCGGLVYGYCSGGAWSMKNEGCVPGCPASKPSSGTACKPPSSTACRYLIPGTSSCTSQCYCADDSRWACITPPCAVDGSPGGVPPF